MSSLYKEEKHKTTTTTERKRNATNKTARLEQTIKNKKKENTNKTANTNYHNNQTQNKPTTHNIHIDVRGCLLCISNTLNTYKPQYNTMQT